MSSCVRDKDKLEYYHGGLQEAYRTALSKKEQDTLKDMKHRAGNVCARL